MLLQLLVDKNPIDSYRYGFADHQNNMDVFGGVLFCFYSFTINDLGQTVSWLASS